MHTYIKRQNQIKSNQITFIVTSPQHKCLGEWNSYERAPDSAKKQQQQQQFTYGQTVQKNNKQFTDGQTVQKNNNDLHMDRQCKKAALGHLQCSRQCKKTTAIYIWTDSAKKQQQFTYGQYIFTDYTEDNVQNTHTYTQYT